jgi:hypothetical protein
MHQDFFSTRQEHSKQLILWVLGSLEGGKVVSLGLNSTENTEQ